MFAPLIHEAAERFQLHQNTAARMVRMVSDALFDSSQGGFSGMRQRFTEAGLGDLFSSWIGTTPGDGALRPEQFGAGFGAQNMQRLMRGLNLPEATASLAGAWLLPRIVGMVSRGGAIPATRPADYDRLFSLSAPVADVPTPVADAATHAADANSRAKPAPTAAHGGWWKWLLLLLLLALGVATALYFLDRATPAASPSRINGDAGAANHPDAAMITPPAAAIRHAADAACGTPAGSCRHWLTFSGQHTAIVILQPDQTGHASAAAVATM